MIHSKNMAEGKVPFGHEGFSEWAKSVTFYTKGFAENVAYNYNCADPVETAVIGWINSEGHRWNMIGYYNLCSISVYCHGGYYYFTQLFALA